MHPSTQHDVEHGHRAPGRSPDHEELVVLLDERRQPAGTMPKRLVHTAETPLHLAFSSYLFDPDGRLLLTRRALGKRAWPGVWTNTCCGHPAPGETSADAASRRLADELGLEAARFETGLETALPDFAYRAVDASGIVEHEVCPVLVARVGGDLRPNPAPEEVVEWQWVAWADAVNLATHTPWLLSPWAVLQIRALAALPDQSFAGVVGGRG